MKKNKILITGFMLIGIISFSGCTGSKPVSSQKDSVETEDKKETKKDDTSNKNKEETEAPKKLVNLSLYDSVKEKYLTYITESEVWGQDDSLNNMAFLVNQDFYSGVVYTLKDLDDNGTEELMIALENVEGNHSLLDIYTISSDNQLVRLTTNENDLGMIGERMSITPLKDGTLLYSGSGGADRHTYAQYSFSDDGTVLSRTREKDGYELFDDLAQPIELDKLEWKALDAMSKIS